MSSSENTTAEHHRGGPIFTAVPQDIIQTQILNRLGGATLATASCVSTELRSLCTNDELWRRICNSTWRSIADDRLSAVIAEFPGGYRSFYSDAYPAFGCRKIGAVTAACELISAVDIYFDGRVVYSKVLETEMVSSWFQNSPFIIDLFDPKEPPATLTLPSEIFSGGEDRLSLSWILIDASKKRAIKVASHKVVEVRRRFPISAVEGDTGTDSDIDTDTQLRYATAVDRGGDEMVECAITVTCRTDGDRKVRLRQVSLQFQDMDGKILTGKQCTRIVAEAMEGERRKGRCGGEPEMEYEMFMSMKERRKEKKIKVEKRLEMLIIAAVEIGVLLAIWKRFVWW